MAMNTVEPPHIELWTPLNRHLFPPNYHSCMDFPQISSDTSVVHLKDTYLPHIYTVACIYYSGR